MATQINQDFHEEKRRLALGNAYSRVHTIQQTTHRMMHPSFQGLPDNSTGSRIHPFFGTAPQNWKPLESPLRGGVLMDDTYRKKILEQRRNDYLAQEAIQEGLPAPDEPRTELTADDTLKIQLYSLIDQVNESLVSNVADIGNYADLMRQITFNLIKLSPGFGGDDIAELVNIFEAMGVIVDAKISDRTPVEVLDSVNMGSLLIMRNSLVKILDFLRGIVPFADRQQADKAAKIRSIIQRIYGKEGITALRGKIQEQAVPFAEDITITETGQNKSKAQLIEDIIKEAKIDTETAKTQLRKELNKRTVAYLRKQLRYIMTKKATKISETTEELTQPVEQILPEESNLDLLTAEPPKQGSGKGDAEQFLIDLVGAKGKTEGSRKNLKVFAKIVADHCPTEMQTKSRTVQKGYLMKLVRAGKLDLSPYMGKKGSGNTQGRLAKMTGVQDIFSRIIAEAHQGNWSNVPPEYYHQIKAYVDEEKAAMQRGREIAAQQAAQQVTPPVPSITVTEIPRARFPPQKVRKTKGGSFDPKKIEQANKAIEKRIQKGVKASAVPDTRNLKQWQADETAKLEFLKSLQPKK